VLHQLRNAGNTLVVIEHNLDVIKTADYVIDLGPEGGDRGGRVVAAGTPEEICEVAESVTGQYLKPLLRDLSARPLKAPPLRLQAVGSLDPSAGPDAIRTRSAGAPRR
jgi:excinuclease ABC subunit A